MFGTTKCSSSGSLVHVALQYFMTQLLSCSKHVKDWIK